MKTTNSYTKSLFVGITINLLVFLCHIFLEKELLVTKPNEVVNLPVSYVTNAILSLLLCISVLLLHKKYENQIGFLFLGLSFVKMLVLYFVVNPTNNLGTVYTIDALAFFVPFGINLIVEQVFIAKLLKISDLAKKNKKE